MSLPRHIHVLDGRTATEEWNMPPQMRTKDFAYTELCAWDMLGADAQVHAHTQSNQSYTYTRIIHDH